MFNESRDFLYFYIEIGMDINFTILMLKKIYFKYYWNIMVIKFIKMFPYLVHFLTLISFIIKNTFYLKMMFHTIFFILTILM